MSTPSTKCPEGRDPAELMEQLERDSREPAVLELQEHLKTCPACAEALKTLRRMDSILKAHPEAFHPTEDELYRFVRTGDDPDEVIAKHVRSCADCMEDVELVRDMIETGARIPATPPKMPESVWGRLHTTQRSPEPAQASWKRIIPWLQSFKMPVRPPMLALGTAGAIVLLVIVLVPQWRTNGLDIGSEMALREPSAPVEEESQPKPESPRDKAAKPKKERPQEFALREAAKDESTKGRDAAAKLPGAPSVDKRLEGAKPPMARMSERKSRKVVAGKLESAPPVAPAMKPSEPRPGLKEAPRRHGMTLQVPEIESPPPPDSLPLLQARLPVRVRVLVVDAQGKEIPWFRFQPSVELQARYSFLPGVEEDARADMKTSDAEVGAPAESKDRPVQVSEYTVVVQVNPTNGAYSLQGRLLDARTGTERKKMDDSGMTKEDLQKAIGSLVSSLLQ